MDGMANVVAKCIYGKIYGQMIIKLLFYNMYAIYACETVVKL